LKQIKQLEDTIQALEIWPDVCLADSNANLTCKTDSFSSPLKVLEISGIDLNNENTTQEDVNTALTTVI
jgi:hypothetical protein